MLTSKCNRGTVWEPLAPDDETRLTCLFARAKSSQKQAGGLAELGHSQIQNGPLSQMCGADKGNPVRKGASRRGKLAALIVPVWAARWDNR